MIQARYMATITAATRYFVTIIGIATWFVAPAVAQRETEGSLDAELLEGLAPVAPPERSAGEDLGDSESPLVRLAMQMREVGDWLGKAQLGTQTQRAQQEIIADLDRMIAQQQRQCQGDGKPAGSNNSSKSASKPGSSSKPGEAGTQAAADSTDSMRPGEYGQTELASPQDLLRKVWGHLPERLHDQMLQNPAERFLPQYEREIEDYYKRLIELDENK